jgi:hypothetical protein
MRRGVIPAFCLPFLPDLGVAGEAGALHLTHRIRPSSLRIHIKWDTPDGVNYRTQLPPTGPFGT